MSKKENQIQKVMKYELHYIDGCGEFSDFQDYARELQRNTREILNKTIQMCYEWEWKSNREHKETGKYPDFKEVMGVDESTYYYRILKDEYYKLSTASVNATIKSAMQKFSSTRNDVHNGIVSIPSYKSNQPIIMHNKSIKISKDNEVWLTILSDKFLKEIGKKKPHFKMVVGDNTQRSILRYIYAGKYSIGESKLKYEKTKDDKRKWFLYLTYKFERTERKLDKNKILGIDLGTALAVCASTYGEHGSLIIKGNEAIEQIKRIKAIKYSKQKQARYCGEGRIGHGTKTRTAPAYNARDKIARIHDTLNHRWSRAVVDYAIKTQCGVIQMEDLSGIKENLDYPKYLEHWTYYDLQTKIEYKAKEAGIEVRKVKPEYTSQRCSHCGYIDKNNRKTQEKFVCLKCRFKANADYNASQNISIENIEVIIQKGLEESKNEVIITEEEMFGANLI